MGQTISRRRESALIPGSTSDLPALVDSDGLSFDSHQNSPTNFERPTSEGSGSRRPSVRRSLLNLVKPIRSRVNSLASTPGDLRRSWRNSRRLSRAPVEPVPTLEDSTQLSSPSIAGPSNVDKGKRPERRAPCGANDLYRETAEEQPIQPSTSLPLPEVASPPASSSAPISQAVEEHPEATGIVQHSTLLQDPVLDILEANPPQAVMEPPNPRHQPVPLAPRQFPPPGTLVIVQGVVHTTDISRTLATHESSSASTPQGAQDDGGRSRTRDRLSALLRPSSSSRPSSVILNEPQTVTSPGAPTMEEASSSLPSSEEVVTPSDSPQPLDTSTEPPPSPQPLEPPPERHPSISSSSIDVLGTLLSVAAAATAASLLTGSSEPILSSGLAPPPRHPSPPAQPPISIPPVPAYPPPPLPPRIGPDISATGRADRMRHAWGTIRERLGLRPSAPSDPSTPVDEDGVPPAREGSVDSVPTDARELMLAEMARAFNIGLGLNGLGGLSAGEPTHGPADTEVVGPAAGNSDQASEWNRESPPATSETALPIGMPLEGSFERFLVDLQLDLRLALTHSEGDIGASTNQAVLDTQAQSQVERPLRSMIPLTTIPRSHSPTPGVRFQPEMVDQTPTLSPSIGVQEHSVTSAPEMTDESDTEDEDEEEEEDFHSANRESLHGEVNHQPSNGMVHSGLGRIDASGRINWWRLYRFPQITAVPLDITASASLRQSGSRSTDSDRRELSASTQSAHSSTPASSTTLSPMVAPSTNEPSNLSSLNQNVDATEGSVGPQRPPHALPNSRSVVPVIIVGLQSVNSEWRDIPSENDDTNSGRQAGNTTDDDADLPIPGGRSFGDDDPTLEGHAGGISGTTGEPLRGHGRSRGWPSRAASAIRNLRSGRRNFDSGPANLQLSNPPNGSRTFLIYVIGGYYPPEHSIVTGGANNFDSFEALLELADLLGQVKSSTVSKEEIEKSGLEVFKASLLLQYFQEDKITANCLDRCLVCLEDYQPEEDVRLMKCRHVFHKGCVDEWMQKGRNNCPACRSTGVSTESRDMSSPTL